MTGGAAPPGGGRPLATVDVGTNSALLLLARRRPDGALEAIHEECVITRLGQAVDGSGILAPEAVARTLAALRRFADRMDRAGAVRRAAVGTAALRDVDNAADFIGPAGEILGCPLEVITGRREAELVLAGVLGAFGEQPDASLIFDVGGGSTELVMCGDSRVRRLVSLQLGAVRLTERHLRRDPPPPDELRRARRQVVEALEAVDDIPACRRVFGVAGTVTTLSAMAQGLDRYDTDRINGARLGLEQVRRQIRQLSTLPLEARAALPGLDPGRADVIIAGALIVEALLGRLGVAELRVCDRGVRWGLLHDLAGM